MATHPVLTVGDGVIEIPAELQNDPRLKKGSKLQLISSGGSVCLEAAPLLINSKSDWRALEGILADEKVDLQALRQQEREWERAHDERKFGIRY